MTSDFFGRSLRTSFLSRRSMNGSSTDAMSNITDRPNHNLPRKTVLLATLALNLVLLLSFKVMDEAQKGHQLYDTSTVNRTARLQIQSRQLDWRDHCSRRCINYHGLLSITIWQRFCRDLQLKTVFTYKLLLNPVLVQSLRINHAKVTDCVTADKKQTVGGGCIWQVGVHVDEVMDVFVSEYRRRHKTQQWIQLQQVVLYWCTSQQQAMIKPHLTASSINTISYNIVFRFIWVSSDNLREKLAKITKAVFIRLKAFADQHPRQTHSASEHAASGISPFY